LIEHHPAGESSALAFEIEYLVRGIELHLLRTDPPGAQNFRFGQTNLIPDHRARFGLVGVFAVVGFLLLFRLDDGASLAHYVHHHSATQ